MNSILVTGAAGFIASHVAEQLLLSGYEVTGIDNLNDYYPVRYKQRNLEHLASFAKFTFEKTDIEDLQALEKLFRSRDFSHIAHLAARAGVRPSIKDPVVYLEANIRGTLNLLECAKKARTENFVLTSSSSVYGNSSRVPFREDDSATDLPISPYAATKKAAEVMGHTYHHLFDMNVTVIRPFTVYGPRGRPDMAPWFFMESILQGSPIPKYGDGSTRRDYTFIDDFVQGFIAALKKPLGYEIFNLGNSQTVSLNEAIETIEQVCGKKAIVQPAPMQPGDVEVTFADVTKARDQLAYNPSTTFREGMMKFHRWFVEEHLGRR